jgi:c-di-GMP-binding flagellar brake protein YcgR
VLRLVEGLQQRRDEVRTRAAVRIGVDARGRRVDRLTDNVSAGGALVSGGAGDVAVGETVPFTLDLRPEGPLIEGRAEVLRADESGSCALRFVDVDHSLRDAIARFVFASERTRVRARRPVR